MENIPELFPHNRLHILRYLHFSDLILLMATRFQKILQASFRCLLKAIPWKIPFQTFLRMTRLFRKHSLELN